MRGVAGGECEVWDVGPTKSEIIVSNYYTVFLFIKTLGVQYTVMR